MKLISIDNRKSHRGLVTLASIASGVTAGTFGAVWAAALLSHIVGGLSAWTAVFVVPPALLFGLGSGYFIYLGWHFPTSTYADRVFDCGDHLLVEKDGTSEEIDFDEILDISYSYVSPMRVSMTTNDSEDERSQIIFCPRSVLVVPALVKSLRERMADR